VNEIAVVAVAVTTVWTGPDAPRPVDAAAVAGRPDPAAWLAAMTLDDRLDLHGRVETQALLGEAVVVAEERRGWAAVQLPAQPSDKAPGGYPGWVPSAHLGPAREAWDGPVATVTAPLASVRADDGEVARLSYGTRLPAEAVGAGRVRLRAPSGWLAVDAGDVAAPAPGGAGLLASARGFTGLAYLWGGCSGWGVDCSGLAHLSLRAAGVTAPRDAGEQSRAATAVPVAAAEAGDLLFFTRTGDAGAHHVAICAGRGRMLHSPATGRHVEEAASGGDPYGPELEPLARRYLPKA
jgi:cell wall-associated NlpC family hydrolase